MSRRARRLIANLAPIVVMVPVGALAGIENLFWVVLGVGVGIGVFCLHMWADE